jgi:hypothetical protein
MVGAARLRREAAWPVCTRQLRRADVASSCPAPLGGRVAALLVSSLPDRQRTAHPYTLTCASLAPSRVLSLTIGLVRYPGSRSQPPAHQATVWCASIWPTGDGPYSTLCVRKPFRRKPFVGSRVAPGPPSTRRITVARRAGQVLGATRLEDRISYPDATRHGNGALEFHV